MELNYRDKREKRYSASSYDDCFRLILDDPRSIVRTIFHANSATKWRKPEFFDEYKSVLCSTLHEKYHQDRTALVEMFNSYFNYWLIRFTLNKMSTKRGFNDAYGDIGDSLEDLTREPVATESSLSELRGSDRETIQWLMRTDCFSSFTSQDFVIYRCYLDGSIEAKKVMSMKQVGAKMNIDPRKARKVISAINKILRNKIKNLNARI